MKKGLEIMSHLVNISEKEIVVAKEMAKDNTTMIMEICMMDFGKETKNMDMEDTLLSVEKCKFYDFSMALENLLPFTLNFVEGEKSLTKSW